LAVVAWEGSDQELLELIRHNAPSAPARLFDRCARLINRVVYRLLGGDAEHDDLVHDVFLKVWSLLRDGRLREPDRLDHYVVAIAANTVKKEIRRRRVRRRFMGQHENAPEAVCQIVSPEVRELLTLSYRLLAELPTNERMAFGLRHMDERPLAEVAELCGCSLATVKRRLSSAEARFRKLASSYPSLVALFDQRASS
jgi:RNA polymerase sigma-70 factor (ECF subfamily)